MNLSLQAVKNNLKFPQNNEISNEVIDMIEANGVSLGEAFSEEEKAEILGYIDGLYISEEAKKQFNKITSNISIIPIKEDQLLGGILSLTQGDYPVMLIGEDVLLNETEKFGHLSQTGTFVEYDPKLIFMHELIHSITGLPDTIPTQEHPNLPKIFSSPEASLGQTQVIANKIHKESNPGNPNAPIRVSYQDVWALHESDLNATTTSIKKGTEFTKGKIVGAQNNTIQIGAFITDRVIETYPSAFGSFGDARIIDTSRNAEQTNDLFIQIEELNDPNTIPLRINTGAGNDYLYGGVNDDTLFGGKDNDYLNGGEGDDELRGNAFVAGTDIDVAEFSDVFENYNIETDENNSSLTTITHEEMSDDVNVNDGTDELYDIEFGIFGGGEPQPLANSNSGAATNSNTASEPARIIPLPLVDGVEDTEIVRAADTTVSPNPNDLPTPPYISLNAPVDMLDGDIDYTLDISPYKPDTQHNVVYILDTSLSIDATELQIMKDAYTELTNFYINEGIAENINFGVVSGV